MMSRMQSGSADTWAAGARKAGRQNRDAVRMTESEVFVVISPWPDGRSNLRQRDRG